MSEDDLHILAAQFQKWEYGVEYHTHYHFDYKGFARAIEQASRRAALEDAALAALAKLKDLTREMEGDSWYGSHPGVPEDDYEDVADAIRALSQQPEKD